MYADAARLLAEEQRLSGQPLADPYLAQAYYYIGERARGKQLLETLHHSSSASVAARAGATLASFLAARGERTRARRLVQSATGGGYMDHHVAYSAGAASAQLGDRAQVLTWLRRATETGFPSYPWFERDPLLQPLRADPTFQRSLGELRRSWESARSWYVQ